MKKQWCFVATLLLLTSCGKNSPSTVVADPIHVADFDTYVYQNCDLAPYVSELDEPYSYYFEGDSIRIDGTQIVPLVADTLTKVTITTSSGRKGEFEVKVINRDYESRHATAETNEGWFDEVTVDPIAAIDTKSEFYNGIDISSSKHLYDLGAKFYNEEGVEESLFRILKNHGVNSVRLRLWNDPTDGDFEYGGGMCDFEHVKWMAKEAVEAGLTYLLDFHYSDFWADPSNQVVPKAWKDFTTSGQYEQAIYDYTYDVLDELRELDILPTIVQVGNETIKGLLCDAPGASQSSPTGADPTYISGSTSLPSSVAGRYSENGDNANLKKYIKSAIKAIKAVDDEIQTMIHLAKGLSGTDFIKGYYDTFSDVDYDIIGLSGYAYWHFGNISTLRTGLQALSSYYEDKKICIVETSYGFTYEKDTYASNSFSTSSESCKVVSGYPCSVQGQASLIRDIIAEVATLDNGIGTYYWEGAWIPCHQGGWSDSLSRASWANQGFFSYDGKVLSSLSLYEQI